VVAALLLPSLIAYLFSRIVGMIWLQWLSAYIALVAVFYAYVGGAMIRQLWFPLLYLLFLVPPPYFLIASITDSRKLWLSTTAVDMLSGLGFDVARSGTTLYIDQYELLVADACAGINSLFSLLAIGCFYIYLLHRADWRYCAVLAILVLPIAMIANLVRVLALMLVTHYFGDAIAQGPFHKLAGVVMFLAALACFVIVDAVLAPVRRRLQRA
jgi:exosortase